MNNHQTKLKNRIKNFKQIQKERIKKEKIWIRFGKGEEKRKFWVLDFVAICRKEGNQIDKLSRIRFPSMDLEVVCNTNQDEYFHL